MALRAALGHATSNRKNAARFYHAYACHLCAEGGIMQAKEQIRLAVEAWEDIRCEIVEDIELSDIWSC